MDVEEGSLIGIVVHLALRHLAGSCASSSTFQVLADGGSSQVQPWGDPWPCAQITILTPPPDIHDPVYSKLPVPDISTGKEESRRFSVSAYRVKVLTCRVTMSQIVLGWLLRSLTQLLQYVVLGIHEAALRLDLKEHWKIYPDAGDQHLKRLEFLACQTVLLSPHEHQSLSCGQPPGVASVTHFMFASSGVNSPFLTAFTRR